MGQPVECKVTSKGLWTKGFLLKNHRVADSIWELAHAIEASGSTRKLGFSIQGKVIRRSGQRILKCWVQDIAITAAPINTHTWLDVVKSMAAVPADMWCQSEESQIIYPRQTEAAMPCAKSCGCHCGKDKGKGKHGQEAAFREQDLDLFKDEDGNEVEEKALGTTTAAGALTPESLERDPKDQGYGNVHKALNFDSCVSILQEHRGLSRSESIVMAEAVFEMNGLNLN